MLAIITSAIWPVVSFLLRGVVAKAVIYGLLLVAVVDIAAYVAGKINLSPAAIAASFGALGEGFWYFFGVFQVPAGLAVILSAHAARFFIRRLPIIG